MELLWLLKAYSAAATLALRQPPPPETRPWEVDAAEAPVALKVTVKLELAGVTGVVVAAVFVKADVTSSCELPRETMLIAVDCQAGLLSITPDTPLIVAVAVDANPNGTVGLSLIHI